MELHAYNEYPVFTYLMKPPVITAIVVVIIVLVGGAAYMYTNPALAAKLGLRHETAQNGMASTTPNRRFGANPGGFATGSIETLNGNDFVITLSDGTTKDIDLSATTTLEKYTNASSTPTMITVNQLSVGEQVFVIGSPNVDGSIIATRVMTGTLPARSTGGRGFHPTPN